MTSQRLWLFLAAALALGTRAGQPVAEDVEKGHAPVTWEQVLALPNHGAAPARHAYGSAPQQTLLALPAQNKSRGVLLLVHGGCWSNAFDREHTLPMARALADEGFDVWIPEYRRVGDPGAGWPNTLNDVVAAVGYVTRTTGTSPWLLGHSAGGHLALRAAYEPGIVTQGVIALAAITDLTGYAQQEGSCQAMVPELLQASLDAEPERYRHASVNGTRLRVPVRLLLGDRDPIVGADQLAGFPGSDVVRIPGAGHFDLIYPGTPAFGQVVDSLNSLVGYDEH